VQRAFTAELDRKMSKTVWMSGCHSWYLAGNGARSSTLWPGYTFDYWWQTRKLDLAAYERLPEWSAELTRHNCVGPASRALR
jgi:hypothetical protein